MGVKSPSVRLVFINVEVDCFMADPVSGVLFKIATDLLRAPLLPGEIGCDNLPQGIGLGCR